MSSTNRRDYSVIVYFLPLVTLLASTTVMLGWIIENAALLQLKPDSSPMIFNTSFCMFFISIGLSISQLSPSWMKRVCAVIPLVMAGLTLFEYISGISVGVDSILYQHFYESTTTPPGRMAISTTVCFLIASLSLLILGKKFWSQFAVMAMSSLLLGFSMMSVLGYSLSFNSEYGWGSFSRMSFLTALCFILLAVTYGLFVFRGLQQQRAPRRVYGPFIVTSLGILVTMSIWAQLLLKDADRARGVLRLHAESMKADLDNAFNPLNNALGRMAKRFRFDRYPTEASWTIDAESYFQDFNGLRRLMYAGPDNKVRWVYPPTPEGVKNIGLDLSFTPALTRTLNRVRHTKLPSITDTFEISPGERGFVLITPIVKEEELKGTLLLIVKASTFIGPMAGYEGYDVTLFENSVKVFSTIRAESRFARDWAVETRYTNFGVGWDVQLIPTQNLVLKNTSMLPAAVLAFGFFVSVLLGLAARLYVKARESELLAHDALAWQKATVNSIPLLFISVDNNGLIRDLNTEAEKLLEYTKEDLVEKFSTPDILLDPRELLDKSVEVSRALKYHVPPGFEVLVSLLSIGQDAASEWTLVSRSGRRYQTILSISPIRMLSSEHSGYLLVFEDITLIKQRERLLEEQEAKILASARLASLGEMAAGIAHEINNPLTIISGHVGVLRRQVNAANTPTEDVVKKLNAIESTVQRIAKIIRGLRSYARETDLTTAEKFLVETMVEDTLSFCIDKFNSNGVLLTTQIESGLELTGRATQISQVLLNLLNNAFDAVLAEPVKEVLVEAKRKNNGIEISVTDSGPGVPMNLRAKVMEPFFTTKEVGKGVGLGLSISTGIIHGHNGKFYLDDKSLRTRFVIWLPV